MAVIVTPLTAPAAVSNGFAGGTITFSNLNGGSALSAGKVVVFIGGSEDNKDPTGFNVGGVTLNEAISDVSEKVRLFYADIPGGTTDSVSFTNGDQFDRVGIQAWHITGLATGGPSDTDVVAYASGNEPLSANVTNGGVAVGALGSFNGTLSTTQTTTWTNVVNTGGDFTTRIDPGLIMGGAHNLTPGSQTITVQAPGGANFNFIAGLVLASWDAVADEPLMAQAIF